MVALAWLPCQPVEKRQNSPSIAHSQDYQCTKAALSFWRGLLFLPGLCDWQPVTNWFVVQNTQNSKDRNRESHIPALKTRARQGSFPKLVLFHNLGQITGQCV